MTEDLWGAFVGRWDAFWFSPQRAFDLCIARPVFYVLFYYFLQPASSIEQWTHFPADGVWIPISYFKWLPFTTPNELAAWVLPLLWRVGVLLSALGLFTRVSTKVVFLVSLYLFPLPFNFGKIDHSTHLPVMISGILALSRCGDYFSLDWFYGYRHRPSRPLEDAAYRWPLMLARAYMGVMYFEAGFQKWRTSGLAWVTSENFQVMLLTRPTVTSLGLWVASHAWLCKALAGITIVFETSAPLALLSPWLAAVIVPFLFCFHIGTYALMGDHGYFLQYDTAYVVWVPWAWLWLRARRAVPVLRLDHSVA